MRGIDGIGEDERGRVDVCVAHSSSCLYIKTRIELPSEHLSTIQNQVLLIMLSHLYSWESYVSKRKNGRSWAGISISRWRTVNIRRPIDSKKKVLWIRKPCLRLGV